MSNRKSLLFLKMLPHDSGEAGERSETDDQQEVGSACERQDGKRVVRGSKAKLCVDGGVTESEETLFSDSVLEPQLLPSLRNRKLYVIVSIRSMRDNVAIQFACDVVYSIELDLLRNRSPSLLFSPSRESFRASSPVFWLQSHQSHPTPITPLELGYSLIATTQNLRI